MSHPTISTFPAFNCAPLLSVSLPHKPNLSCRTATATDASPHPPPAPQPAPQEEQQMDVDHWTRYKQTGKGNEDQGQEIMQKGKEARTVGTKGKGFEVSLGYFLANVVGVEQ